MPHARDLAPGSDAVVRRTFVRRAGAGALVGAASLLPAAKALAFQGVGSVDRRKLSDFPVVSDRERERRWGAAWKLMQASRVDALLVMQGPASNFFSNYETASIILFTKAGAKPPISFLPGLSGQQVDFLFRSEMHGQVSWIRDWRITKGEGPDLVEGINEMQLAKSRVGTIGLARGESWAVNPMQAYLKASLPGVTFVELYDQFLPLWLTHSRDELEMLRKAALGLEAACESLVKAVEPGASLYDIEVAALGGAVPFGLTASLVSIYTGPRGGRGNWWFGRGLPPPRVKAGDLVNAEIACGCGHMSARGQVTVSVGTPAPETAALARLVREAYDAGFAQIKPGNTFGAVCDAMAAPNRKAGAWNIAPLVTSLNPIEARSGAREGMWERLPALKQRAGVPRPPARIEHADLVLQEGMTFALRPNSLLDDRFVSIGGTVICTANGADALNRNPTRLVTVDS